MTVKNDVTVVIDGKVITLSGYESNEYMQRIASYIDGKIKEYSANEIYRKNSYDMRHVMLELNLADDYFKAKRQVELKQEEIDQKDKEIYDLKHELIALQIKLENLEKRHNKTKKELAEEKKNVVRLETRLNTLQEEPGSTSDKKESH